MGRIVAGVLFLIGMMGCAGLAQDVNKGAGTTEREVNKELGHDRTIRDGGSPADAADAGTISM